MKEQINFPGTSSREDLVNDDENASCGSDEVIRSVRSLTEDSFDEPMPTASPKEVTAFESVEDVPKRVGHFLVQAVRNADT